MTMNEEENRDMYLEEMLTEVIAPYIGALPAEELGALRVELRAAVADDVELRRLHQAARPRAAPARTGDAVAPGAEDAAAAITPRREGAA
jgi:hypothetical protein